ncbi:MAG: ABC transporter ATP-binding protein [Ignavibacteria bacterium]|nr:ABC transporter ATP-binding protein [Ignavibacteria bacterium]MCU7504231.1 ABC transporter ATP-binding protein [Ignavibacteria bacterium]MCU7516076.1 ABC transporter ATP-binding protein [Ignavibacteria bacterium]
MNSEQVIEVKGLTKQFKDVKAVNNLDLNVFKGDVFGFLGPNGAGKSTTIRMLLSLIKPTSGSIKIFGMPLEKKRRDILRKIGAIVEKPDFYLYLSAYKNLELLGKISETDTSRNRIMEMLELVGLEKRYNSKVKTFSHGMKQRLGLAQALLHDPDLIILDEPTTGLDPQGMKEIRDLILHLSREKGKTVFLSSHILSEVEIIATRMIIINKGTARVEGTVNGLLNSGILKVTVRVEDPARTLSLLNASRWADSLESHANSDLFFNLKKEEIPALNKFLVESNVPVNALIPMRSLEDYFLAITEGKE